MITNHKIPVQSFWKPKKIYEELSNLAKGDKDDFCARIDFGLCPGVGHNILRRTAAAAAIATRGDGGGQLYLLNSIEFLNQILLILMKTCSKVYWDCCEEPM